MAKVPIGRDCSQAPHPVHALSFIQLYLHLSRIVHLRVGHSSMQTPHSGHPCQTSINHDLSFMIFISFESSGMTEHPFHSIYTHVFTRWIKCRRYDRRLVLGGLGIEVFKYHRIRTSINTVTVVHFAKSVCSTAGSKRFSFLACDTLPEFSHQQLSEKCSKSQPFFRRPRLFVLDMWFLPENV